MQHERLHRVERAGLLALVDGAVEAGAGGLVDAATAEAVLLLERIQPALVGERQRQLLAGDAEVAGGTVAITSCIRNTSVHNCSSPKVS